MKKREYINLYGYLMQKQEQLENDVINSNRGLYLRGDNNLDVFDHCECIISSTRYDMFLELLNELMEILKFEDKDNLIHQSICKRCEFQGRCKAKSYEIVRSSSNNLVVDCERFVEKWT